MVVRHKKKQPGSAVACVGVKPLLNGENSTLVHALVAFAMVAVRLAAHALAHRFSIEHHFLLSRQGGVESLGGFGHLGHVGIALGFHGLHGVDALRRGQLGHVGGLGPVGTHAAMGHGLGGLGKLVPAGFLLRGEFELGFQLSLALAVLLRHALLHFFCPWAIGRAVTAAVAPSHGGGGSTHQQHSSGCGQKTLGQFVHGGSLKQAFWQGVCHRSRRCCYTIMDGMDVL
jgi:hypothetical protein